MVFSACANALVRMKLLTVLPSKPAARSSACLALCFNRRLMRSCLVSVAALMVKTLHRRGQCEELYVKVVPSFNARCVTGHSHFFDSLKERGNLRQHFVHDRHQHGSAARTWSSTLRSPASRPVKSYACYMTP